MDVKIKDERGFNQLFGSVGSSPFRAHRRNVWFANQALKKSARRILEIGCGTGEASALVAQQTEAEVIGLDLSQTFIDRARSLHQAPNLRFERADILAEGSCRFGEFDFIFGNGILHHLVTCLEKTLQTLRGVTTKNGGAAFIEPNFANPYCAFIFGTKVGRKFALLEPDEMAFKANELRSVFLKSGWKNVDLTTRDFLLPGLPVGLVKPILAVEPYIEASGITNWLAQSHFVTADAAH